MDKAYNHKDYEQKIYKQWEYSGAFKEVAGKKPYTVLMPPPNANASLHAGHAMYTVDDILVRYKRMLGMSALWIPGMDHAGFETQYVYEKHLAKAGKSRMDFDRKTLYNNIFKFVQDNSGQIYKQFKRLGFCADWDRSVFTLDPQVTKQVYETFTKMHTEGFVYRDSYIVNYCTHCGTSLAELEVKHVERVDPLYYIKYGPFILATVRPETKFGDTAIAVHPADKRYKNWIGKEVEVQGLIGKFKLKVIADNAIDPDFGTGVVKVTPGHDPNDFEMGKRHNLEIKQIIDFNGKLTPIAGPYAGMKVKAAREKVAHDLQQIGLMEKIDTNYTHSIITCYKCGRDLEPLTVPNWFIKVSDLKKKVIQVVEDEQVKFHPKRFKKHMLSWLEIMHDWPISRQIVWGIRIPVWYNIDQNPNLVVIFLDKNKKIVTGETKDLLEKHSLSEIKAGLQKLIAPKESVYEISSDSPGEKYLPETDTFDTWFSSGQWPLVTLKDKEFETRFPTDFIGTLSDILKFWISRMIMFSLYLKNEVPYKDVYLWATVADKEGKKMSKSKGNVINPLELVDKYGADALRFSLIYGTPAGSKVILSDEKVKGMRNFSNKVWNMGRFLKMLIEEQGETLIPEFSASLETSETDKKMVSRLAEIIQIVTQALENFKLSLAAETLYDFIWHEIADVYIEEVKQRQDKKTGLAVLKHIYLQSLKLLHPFMPFVTEAVWSELGQKDQLIASHWPTK